MPAMTIGQVAKRAGTQTYAKIRQNLLWAFCFNAVGIPIAASGWLHPTITIAAMASSTLGILLNSFGLRLSRLAGFIEPCSLGANAVFLSYTAPLLGWRRVAEARGSGAGGSTCTIRLPTEVTAVNSLWPVV